MSLNTDQDTTQTEREPVVYIRSVSVHDIRAELHQSEVEDQLRALSDEAELYSVHNEDGERVAIFSDRDMAFEVSRQNGAEPVSVH